MSTPASLYAGWRTSWLSINYFNIKSIPLNTKQLIHQDSTFWHGTRQARRTIMNVQWTGYIALLLGLKSLWSINIYQIKNAPRSLAGACQLRGDNLGVDWPRWMPNLKCRKGPQSNRWRQTHWLPSRAEERLSHILRWQGGCVDLQNPLRGGAQFPAQPREPRWCRVFIVRSSPDPPFLFSLS